MKRILLAALLLAPLSACQVTPERGAALTPLPANGPPLPYAELLTRARAQATVATEAFYVNRWTELEDAARGLERTARYLARAEDVPARQKDTLAVTSADLGKLGGKLREAAATKNVKESNDLLQQVHLKVRELRLDR